MALSDGMARSLLSAAVLARRIVHVRRLDNNTGSRLLFTLTPRLQLFALPCLCTCLALHTKYNALPCLVSLDRQASDHYTARGFALLSMLLACLLLLPAVCSLGWPSRPITRSLRSQKEWERAAETVVMEWCSRRVAGGYWRPLGHLPTEAAPPSSTDCRVCPSSTVGAS